MEFLTTKLLKKKNKKSDLRVSGLHIRRKKTIFLSQMQTKQKKRTLLDSTMMI
jgi:hypothetical protein